MRSVVVNTVFDKLILATILLIGESANEICNVVDV